MERFFRTLFPGRATVCGVSLPPLSLWRLAALQAIASPFVSNDPKTRITPSDLTLAVQTVCCGNMLPPDLRPCWRSRRWTAKMNKNGKIWKSQASAFVAYLKIHQLSPELWRDELREPRYITAPIVMSQVAGLLNLGLTHSEAWNTSPGYAAWLLLTAAERECSSIKFADDEDQEVAFMPTDELEIREQARRDLGKNFDAWLAARIKNNYPV